MGVKKLNHKLGAAIDTDTKGRRNLKKRGPKKRGKFIGIFKHASGRWQAGIHVREEFKYLGLHDNAKTAALVYDTWARRLHGARAVLNFPKIASNGAGNAQQARAHL